jgi:hypothetical protein
MLFYYQRLFNIYHSFAIEAVPWSRSINSTNKLFLIHLGCCALYFSLLGTRNNRIPQLKDHNSGNFFQLQHPKVTCFEEEQKVAYKDLMKDWKNEKLGARGYGGEVEAWESSLTVVSTSWTSYSCQYSDCTTVLDNQGSIPGRAEFSLHHKVRTGSVAHPTSYPMAAGVPSSRPKRTRREATIHLHLVPSLRYKAESPAPHASDGVALSTLKDEYTAALHAHISLGRWTIRPWWQQFRHIVSPHRHEQQPNNTGHLSKSFPIYLQHPDGRHRCSS